MNYEGINFTDRWVQSVSFEQFMAELEINQHWWKNDPKRKEKAKEVYFLINPKSKKAAAPKAAASIEINDDLLDGLKDRIDKKLKDDNIHGSASNDQ